MKIPSLALLLLLPSLIKAEADQKLPLSADNVHWGYFSKTLSPVLNVSSGSTVEVEMATHHGCDDWDLMIEGDPGMEDVFYWSHMGPANQHYRGASGGGDGVHILTGPIYVEDAGECGVDKLCMHVTLTLLLIHSSSSPH